MSENVSDEELKEFLHWLTDNLSKEELKDVLEMPDMSDKEFKEFENWLNKYFDSNPDVLDNDQMKKFLKITKTDVRDTPIKKYLKDFDSAKLKFKSRRKKSKVNKSRRKKSKVKKSRRKKSKVKKSRRKR